MQRRGDRPCAGRFALRAMTCTDARPRAEPRRPSARAAAEGSRQPAWSTAPGAAVSSEMLDDARELRETEDPLRRQVGDVREVVKREEMMHALRLKRNIAPHDELVRSLLVGKAREAKWLGRQQLGVGGRHSPRFSRNPTAPDQPPARSAASAPRTPPPPDPPARLAERGPSLSDPAQQ
jgi:hypothetical protein